MLVRKRSDFVDGGTMFEQYSFGDEGAISPLSDGRLVEQLFWGIPIFHSFIVWILECAPCGVRLVADVVNQWF